MADLANISDSNMMNIEDSRSTFGGEETSTIEGLDFFCKAVEIYNIIEDRASKNPWFLKRRLRYKTHQKYEGRVQMTILLPLAQNTTPENQNVLPMCVLLGKEVSGQQNAQDYTVFRFGRVKILPAETKEGLNHVRANFQLPKIDELSTLNTSCLYIIFVISATITQDTMNLLSFPSNVEGECLVGKVSIDLLYQIWTNTESWSLGQTADTYLTVNLNPHFLKPNVSEGKTTSFGLTATSEASATSKQIKLVISAWELGVTGKNPYASSAHRAIPSSSSQNLRRLRSGNVVFNYRQHHDNKLLKSEVTEDFSCPFCLMKCASFKGLSCHLCASHDLFRYVFSVTEESQTVDVTPKYDTWTPEIIGRDVDPQNQEFVLCAKSLRPKKLRSVVQDANRTQRPDFDLNVVQPDDEQIGASTDVPADPDGVQTVPQSSHPPPENTLHGNVGQDTDKDRDPSQSAPNVQPPPPSKLQHTNAWMMTFIDNGSPSFYLKHHGKFFHSQSCQPMTLEEVLSNHDSEAEIDYDFDDFKDRISLDDFIDVTHEEKHMMQLWNSFVRRNRVMFGCHIPWACEAFTILYTDAFLQMPGLFWCWIMFMIILWDYGLVNGETMNTCFKMLDKFTKRWNLC